MKAFVVRKLPRALILALAFLLGTSVIVQAAGGLFSIDPGSAAVSPLGGSSSADGISVEFGSTPPTNPTVADYRQAYAEAQRLLDQGRAFRMQRLQRLDPEKCRAEQSNAEYCQFSMTNVANNYTDFVADSRFREFCADYAAIDAYGRCASDSVRTNLIEAARIFAFLTVAQPANLQFDSDAPPVRDLGAQGILEATNEIANVHMIFGNEFVVKAVSRPFSTDGADSEVLVRDEIERLEKALEQYQLATAVLVQALNFNLGGATDIFIGDYFTEREFQLFSAASERQVQVLIEIAKRERILPGRPAERDRAAVRRLNQAYADQYLQAMALASAAVGSNRDDPNTPDVDEGRTFFLNNGGWQIIGNLQRITQTAQTIDAGLNPLGYDEAFVPLRAFEELLELACGGRRSCTQGGGLLNTATQAGAALRDWNREFDQNYSELLAQLSELQDGYDDRLLELCGAATSVGADGLRRFDPCGPRDTNSNNRIDRGDQFGGLLGQNYWELRAAAEGVSLARHRVDAIPQQIQIEQERAERVIGVITATGEQINAYQLAIGMAQAFRQVTVVSTVYSEEYYMGAEASAVASSKLSGKVGVNPVACIAGSCDVTLEQSLEARLETTLGTRLSRTHLNTTDTIYDASALQVSGFEQLITAQETLRDAEIEGANSDAVIKQLLLDQAAALIDLEIALNQLNQVIAEQNLLVAQYHQAMEQRQSSWEAIKFDSPLTKPYTRLFRDAAALSSISTLDQATQAAYLAAKAYEYLTMNPVPYMDELYRVRNADNLRVFLDKLSADYAALPREQFSKRTYRLSLAEDLLGLTDENLNPDGALAPAQVADERARLFREFLEANRYRANGEDKIAYVFGTTLDHPKFLRGVFNNRIARISNDDPGCASGCRGLWLNLVTDQQAGEFRGDLPQIRLSHGGSATYRNGSLREVTYRPGPALMIGRTLPPGFGGETRAAVMTSHINLGPSEEPNRNYLEDRFFDLSIATSQWIIEIDLTSPSENTRLDLSKIRDIEIRMDTTYVTPAANARFVAMDTQRLNALESGAPLPAEVAAFLEAHEAPAQLEAPAPAAAAIAAPTQATAGVSGYAYRGQFFVSAPVNLGTAAIGFDLAIADDGTISGRLCRGCTPLYTEAPSISGSYDAAAQTMSFTTAVFGGTINGREVQRTIAFSGAFDPATNELEGTYVETLTGYTPDPLVTEGEFLVTRGEAPVTILPDSPAVLVNPDNLYLVAGGASVSYNVVLGSKPTAPVTIAIVGDAQVVTNPTELTFTPENWDVPQSVSVGAPRTSDAAAIRQALIRHTITSADGTYAALAVADLVVQISNRAEDPGTQSRLYLPLIMRNDG